MERGLKIPQSERTKTTNSLLMSLINQLEKVYITVVVIIIIVIIIKFRRLKAKLLLVLLNFLLAKLTK